MICKHCKEEVKSIKAYRKAFYVQEVRIIDHEPFGDNNFMIEFPAGKPAYDFRCTCGGDLNDKYRECVSLLNKGAT